MRRDPDDFKIDKHDVLNSADILLEPHMSEYHSSQH